MPDDVTPHDPAPPGAGPTGGQTPDLDKDVRELRQKVAGYDGYIKQLKGDHDKALVAVTGERDTLKVTLEQATRTLAGLQTRVAELEPFQAKVGELETSLREQAGKFERLELMSQHPALLGNAALRSLVESSTLSGDALKQQIDLLAAGLPAAPAGGALSPSPAGATPPRPNGSVKRRAKAIWDEAQKLSLGSREWREAMNEYYRVADQERPFMPPEEQEFVGDFPASDKE